MARRERAIHQTRRRLKLDDISALDPRLRPRITGERARGLAQNSIREPPASTPSCHGPPRAGHPAGSRRPAHRLGAFPRPHGVSSVLSRGARPARWILGSAPEDDGRKSWPRPQLRSRTPGSPLSCHGPPRAGHPPDAAAPQARRHLGPGSSGLRPRMTGERARGLAQNSIREPPASTPSCHGPPRAGHPAGSHRGAHRPGTSRGPPARLPSGAEEPAAASVPPAPRRGAGHRRGGADRRPTLRPADRAEVGASSPSCGRRPTRSRFRPEPRSGWSRCRCGVS